jgi:hypothetical protein
MGAAVKLVGGEEDALLLSRCEKKKKIKKQFRPPVERGGWQGARPLRGFEQVKFWRSSSPRHQQSGLLCLWPRPGRR